VAAEIRFNQGPSSSATGVRKVLFVGPMTSSGTWTAGTVYEAPDEKTVRDGAGAGSPLHQSGRMFGKINKTAKKFYLPVAATNTGAPVAANMTIIVTMSSGTNPTATGKLTLRLGGEVVDIGFKTSDTVTTIGDLIESAINVRDWLGYTASNSGGTVTLTAKIPGISQGDGTTGVHRVGAVVEPGKNVIVTPEAAALGLGTGADGVEGDVTEIAGITAALATVTNRDEYYIVSASQWSAAGLAVFKSHIVSRNEPNPGKFGCVIAANTGALSAAQTIATGLNTNLINILWQKNSEHTPAELAGAYAAILQKYEELDPTANLNGYGEADWPILPQYSSADWPDGDDLNDAVLDGLSPVEAVNSSRTLLGMNVTTQSKNAAGSLDDPRSLERHRVSGAHHLLTKLKTRWALTFARKKLRKDVYDASGKPINQTLLPEVTTPLLARPFVVKWIREEERHLAGLEEPIETLTLQVDPQNGSRMQCGFSFKVIDHLNQTSFLAAETNGG